MIRNRLAVLALAALASACAARAQIEASPRRLPAPALASPPPAKPGLETAVFSGGCFWGVQGVFSHVKGVRSAVSGYAGGLDATAHYDLVSTGTTGHAESVKVTFDPKAISYGELLQVFFSVALDPTQVDRQGPDEGSQYRSVLWVENPEQKREAQAYIGQLSAAHAFSAPIATKVRTLPAFYAAEGYHQDFFARHPDHPYIRAWDVQKVAALKTLYPATYVARPAS